MLTDLLQGKPFRYPLHTMLVHFPVGLFAISLVFDLASWVWPWPALTRAASITMIGGLATAFAAALPGLVDWALIRSDHPGKKIATTHMIVNVAAVGLYAFNLLALRPGFTQFSTTPVVPLLFSMIGMGLLGFSGFLGGRLVYEEGIAVGRHRRQTRTPAQTIKVFTWQAAGGKVPVAPASDLGEGETLRVDFDGTIIAIARLDDALYAFQEFCTHRFAPLSEGTFHGREVECPWHRSCFDVCTGKVTQGPAKVDLKTYRVSMADGMIQLEVQPGALGQVEKRAPFATPAGNGHNGNSHKQRQPKVVEPA